MTNKIIFSLLVENGTSKILRAAGKVDEGMETHLSDKDAYFWVQSGKVLFRIDDTKQHLKSQEGMNIPANAAHSFTVLEESDVLLIMSPEAKITFIR
jgi:mannose-6-phosphate isomerase-like protein (cupin superfamily)